MGRPALIRDRRDRLRVVDDETVHDDLPAAEREREDAADAAQNAEARFDEGAVREWDDRDDSPAIPDQPDENGPGAPPSLVATEADQIARAPAGRVKAGGQTASAISLILMALAAGTLSAAVVLFLF